MDEALITILEKKDFEYITIMEICEAAGVNRSTFYLHYDTIEDLLEETLEELNKEFIHSMSAYIPSKMQSKDNAFLITEEYLIPYLKFCKKNKRILKLVYKKPRLFQRDKAYKKMYDSVFYPAISKFVQEENQRVYNLEFFTQGIAGIVRKWIELDCKTEVEELIQIIKDCVDFSIEQIERK